MPITIRRKGTAPVAEAEGPSTLRRILAGGARVGAGVLATPVGMVPSPVTTSAAGAIGSLGELLAQRIEGSEPNFKRALVEGGIAAVPFGKLVKGGRALQSAVRSGALSGVGEAGRELSMGEELSPGSIGLTALLGGATGGILGKLTPPVLHADGGAAKTVGSDVVEPTITSGGRTLVGGKIKVTRGVPKLTRAKAGPATAVSSIPRSGQPITMGPATTAGGVGTEIERAMTDEELALADDAIRSAIGFKNADTVDPLPPLYRASAKAAAKEDEATREIKDMLKGLEAQPPTVTESYAAGPLRGTRRFTPPKPEKPTTPGAGGSAVVDDLDDLSIAENTIDDMDPALFSGAAKAPANPYQELDDWLSRPNDPPWEMVGREVTNTPVPTTEATSELAQLFKSRVGATGKNYRQAKQAEAAGEIPTSGFAREAHLREQAALGGASPTPPVSEIPPTAGSWVDEQSQLVDDLMKAKQQGGDTTMGMDFGLSSLLSGLQKDPEVAAMLGLGTAGAVVGGVTDPLNDPLSSAGTGFAAGLASPVAVSALAKLGISQHLIPTIAEKVKTPQGVMEVAKNIGRSIPQLQRFNLLADEVGLPANALVGPYMSGVMGALTKGLSGDARGWAALRELANTPGFFKEVLNSREEAIALIRSGDEGRAEMGLLEGMGDPRKNPITWPGVAMTSGDLGSRRILMRHGFSEDEARAITMTSEPELAAPHAMAEFGKRSPFLQFLFPFRRTPANILEQGAHRIPGLGLVTQSFRKTPDSLREQAWQQGLGAGFGAAGYVAGQEMDPETARIARRYMTNASGQFSLPMSLGLAAGQAVGSGRPIVSGDTLRAVDQALPLPSAEPLTDLLGALGGGRIPRGAIPAVVHRQLYPPNASTTLRPITIRRRQ